MQHTLQLTGTLRPNDRAIIRSEVEGKIKTIHFKEGTYVDKGAPLLDLDDARPRLELEEVKARLNHAKHEYERAQKLFSDHILSSSDRDRRQSEMESLQSQADRLEVMLQKHKIYAPFDGMIGLKEISEGEFVNTGKELVALVDYTPLKIDFRVPEMHLRHIRVGQTVRVRPNEFEQEFFAEVAAIDPVGDSSGHSFVVRAVLQDQSSSMRPGGFTEVFVPLEEGEKSIIVPESAIERRGDVDTVYRIIDGLVARTPVTTGTRKGGEVEVLSGVDEGNYVITAGHMKARDNKPVTIKETIVSSSGQETEKKTDAQTPGSSSPAADKPEAKEGFWKKCVRVVKGLFQRKESKEEGKPAAATTKPPGESSSPAQKAEPPASKETPTKEPPAPAADAKGKDAPLSVEGTSTEKKAEGFLKKTGAFFKKIFSRDKKEPAGASPPKTGESSPEKAAAETPQPSPSSKTESVTSEEKAEGFLKKTGEFFKKIFSRDKKEPAEVSPPKTGESSPEKAAAETLQPSPLSKTESVVTEEEKAEGFLKKAGVFFKKIFSLGKKEPAGAPSDPNAGESREKRDTSGDSDAAPAPSRPS
jgi:membrane fusion protein (multidrug efflux system)